MSTNYGSSQLSSIYNLLGATSPDDYVAPEYVAPNYSGVSSLPQSNIDDAQLAQQVLANYQSQVPPVKQGWMNSPSGNFIESGAKDVARLATGLGSMVLHPWDTAKHIGKELNDYYTNMAYDDNPWYIDAIRGGMDAYNILTDPIFKGRDVRDVITGRKTLGQFAQQVGENIYNAPVSSALSVLGVKGLASGGKVARAATAANTVEDAINIAKQTTGKQAQKVIDMGEKLKKTYSYDDLTQAFQAHRVGSLVDESLKPVTKDVGQFLNDYDKLLSKTNSRAKGFTKETKFEIADSQAAHETSMKLGEELPYQQIAKERQPYYDLLKNKPEEVSALAKEGDLIAQDILNNKQLFDKGYLKIIPMAGIKDVEKLGYAAAEGTKYAGRASDRVFGTATNEQVVKQVVQDTSNWMDKQMGDFVKTELMDEIKNGTLGGKPLVSETTKDVSYIPREIVETGSLEQAIESASKDINNAVDSVAIDTKLLQQLKNQANLISGSNPFTDPWLSDLYNIRKSTMLASGRYLVGNAQTGLANMILNEGINPMNYARDLAGVLQTQGELAKTLGVYRNLARTESRMKSGVGQVIGKINATPANILSAADAKMQNFFAEMAAHANLRAKGIPVSERVQAIDKMKLDDLANTINDVKKVALLNPPKAILPKSAQKAAGFLSPFWRWTDTAAQSSIYMFKKNPLMSYYAASNILASAGFDTEMQRRLNLNVSLDKPFVSYRSNMRTGQPEEVSIEFAPQMNTLKVGGNLLRAISSGGKEGTKDILPSAIPFWSSMIGAFKGVDSYGNPIKRPELDSKDIQNSMAIANGKRYQWDSTKGGYMQMEGGKLDEVLTTGVENVIGYRSLLNNTVLPAAASTASLLTGNQINYYKPYGNSLFGSFGGSEPLPNVGSIIAGDPAKPTSIPEVQNIVQGTYSTPYFPEREFASRGTNRQLLRGAARRDMRIRQMQGGM